MPLRLALLAAAILAVVFSFIAGGGQIVATVYALDATGVLPFWQVVDAALGLAGIVLMIRYWPFAKKDATHLYALAPLAIALGLVAFPPLAALAQEVGVPQPSTLATLLSSLGAGVLTLSSVAGFAAWLAAALPKASGPGVYAFTRAVLDAFGANFGNARNAS